MIHGSELTKSDRLDLLKILQMASSDKILTPDMWCRFVGDDLDLAEAVISTYEEEVPHSTNRSFPEMTSFFRYLARFPFKHSKTELTLDQFENPPTELLSITDYLHETLYPTLESIRQSMKSVT
jgi:hypothetical protein